MYMYMMVTILHGGFVRDDNRHAASLNAVPSPLISPTDNLPSSPGTTTSPVFSEFKSIQGKAQLMSLRCQELCQKFDKKLENLGNELETQSDRFMSELEEVEVWIQNAYSILRQEPAREIEGVYSQEEMDAEEAEVIGQRARDAGLPLESVPGPGGGAHQFGYAVGSPDMLSSGEFLPSDGSLGSEGFVGSLEEGKVHDTSVDPDLSDEEYTRQVVGQAISPEPEGETSVDDDQEYNVSFSMSTADVSHAVWYDGVYIVNEFLCLTVCVCVTVCEQSIFLRGQAS